MKCAKQNRKHLLMWQHLDTVKGFLFQEYYDYVTEEIDKMIMEDIKKAIAGDVPVFNN